MKLQDLKSSCGAASLVNALQALGDHAFQEVVWQLAGGDADGADERQLRDAMEALGYVGRPASPRRRADAMAWLRRQLAAGRPVIIAVAQDDPADHWVTVVGQLGSRFLVADPADAELVVSVDAKRLAEWWHDGEVYFGIAVERQGRG